MLYHWKQPRVWGIGTSSEMVEPGRFETHQVMFLPGVHEMPDDDWERLKKSPNFKVVEERIDGGMLQVELEKVKEGKKAVKQTESGMPASLDNFDPKDAVELISGVMEEDQLKVWDKGEKRPAVKKAIKEQLKAIDYVTKPKDENKGE